MLKIVGQVLTTHLETSNGEKENATQVLDVASVKVES